MPVVGPRGWRLSSRHACAASGRKKSLAGGGGLAKGNMRSMKGDLLRSIQQGFLKFAAERIHRARLAAAAALKLVVADSPRAICGP